MVAAITIATISVTIATVTNAFATATTPMNFLNSLANLMSP